jgi:putative spermidine/putrescine transport system permease protein
MRRGWTDRVLALLAGLGWLAMVAPLVVVAGVALNAGRTLSFPPQGLSLQWFAAALGSDGLMGSLWLSLRLALVTTVLALAVGVPAALGIVRLARRQALVTQMLSAPLLLPGLVIGFGLYILVAVFAPVLRGSLITLVLGHVVVAMPWVITTTLAAARRLDPDLPEVARSLGAGAMRIFLRITLPGLAPGIVAGGIFSFIASFSQFDVSLFLGTANATPLPVALFTSLQNRADPSIAAMGMVSILTVMAAMALVNRMFSISTLFGGQAGRPDQ